MMMMMTTYLKADLREGGAKRTTSGSYPKSRRTAMRKKTDKKMEDE